MDKTINILHKNHNLQNLISQSISKLNKYQQIKLLEFINSLFLNTKEDTNKLLKYSGFIEKTELELMKKAILDCEKIDYNEWELLWTSKKRIKRQGKSNSRK